MRSKLSPEEHERIFREVILPAYGLSNTRSPRRVQPSPYGDLAPPPVPQAVREVFRECADCLERVQAVLDDIVASPLISAPPFEDWLWRFHGLLSELHQEASQELDHASECGDWESFARASRKLSAVRRAHALRLEHHAELDAYFDANAAVLVERAWTKTGQGPRQGMD